VLTYTLQFQKLTVFDRTKIRKLRWFEHLMRMPEQKWPAVIHSWIPVGRRKRGQPRQLWHHRGNGIKWDGVRRCPGPETLGRQVDSLINKTELVKVQYINCF
jgi:hypothetical protein